MCTSLKTGGGITTLSSDRDVAQAAACSLPIVFSSLTITGGVTSLAGLHRTSGIRGSLTISAESLLSLTGLENLETVDENLVVSAGVPITTLAGLANLRSVGGYISISSATLQSLHGLGALQNCRDLYIYAGLVLADLSSLANLTEVGSRLQLHGMGRGPATTLVFPALTKVVSRLEIYDWPNVTSIRFPSLRQSPSIFTVVGIDALQSLTRAGSFPNFGGSLSGSTVLFNHMLCQENIDQDLFKFMPGLGISTNGGGCTVAQPHICRLDGATIQLTTQAAVEAFGQRNCSKIIGPGRITIVGTETADIGSEPDPVTSVEPLHHLRELTNSVIFRLYAHDTITSLQGLEGLHGIHGGELLLNLGAMKHIGQALSRFGVAFGVFNSGGEFVLVAGALVEPLSVWLANMSYASRLVLSGGGSAPLDAIELPNCEFVNRLEIYDWPSVTSIRFPSLRQSPSSSFNVQAMDALQSLTRAGSFPALVGKLLGGSAVIADNLLLCTIDETLFNPPPTLQRNGFGCPFALRLVSTKSDSTFIFTVTARHHSYIRPATPTFLHPSLESSLTFTVEAPISQPRSDVVYGALPPGLSIDPGSGTISGIVPASSVQTYTFLLRATASGSGLESAEVVSIVVFPPLEIADVSSPITQTAPETTALAEYRNRVTVNFQGGQAPFSLQPLFVPPGLRLNTISQIPSSSHILIFDISGALAAAGAYNISVAIVDSNGARLNTTAVVTALPPLAVIAGEIHVTEGSAVKRGLPELRGGLPLNSSMTVSSYEYVPIAGLPPGMVLMADPDPAVETSNGYSGRAVLRGTPQTAGPDTSLLTFSVHDQHRATAVITVRYVVAKALSLVLQPPSLRTAQQFGEYSSSISLTLDGGRSPVVLEVVETVGDNVVDGLVIDKGPGSRAVIRGRPLSAGTQNLTIRATDANGAVSRTVPFALEVTADGLAAESSSDGALSGATGIGFGVSVAALVLGLVVLVTVVYMRHRRKLAQMQAQLDDVNARAAEAFVAQAAGGDEADEGHNERRASALACEAAFQKLEVSPERLVLGAELGSGEFGVVLAALLLRSDEDDVLVSESAADDGHVGQRRTGNAGRLGGRWCGFLRRRPAGQQVGAEERSVAVKMLKDSADMEEQEKFLLEARCLAALQHPNIVKVLGVCRKQRPIMLLLEIMSADLRSHLRGLPRMMRSSVTAGQLIQVIVQVASAMEYLEHNRIIHRDLAARNVLVAGSDLAVVKLSDFGMSRRTEGAATYYRKTSNEKVPVKWMAPESIRQKLYTHKSDVWSFAVLAWEVFSFGSTPFAAQTSVEAVLSISLGSRLPQPKSCPDEVYEELLKCWSMRPQARPTFGELHRNLVEHSKLQVAAATETGQNLSQRYTEGLLENDVRQQPQSPAYDVGKGDFGLDEEAIADERNGYMTPYEDSNVRGNPYLLSGGKEGGLFAHPGQKDVERNQSVIYDGGDYWEPEAISPDLCSDYLEISSLPDLQDGGGDGRPGRLGLLRKAPGGDAMSSTTGSGVVIVPVLGDTSTLEDVERVLLGQPHGAFVLRRTAGGDLSDDSLGSLQLHVVLEDENISEGIATLNVEELRNGFVRIAGQKSAMQFPSTADMVAFYSSRGKLECGDGDGSGGDSARVRLVLPGSGGGVFFAAAADEASSVPGARESGTLVHNPVFEPDLMVDSTCTNAPGYVDLEHGAASAAFKPGPLVRMSGSQSKLKPKPKQAPALAPRSTSSRSRDLASRASGRGDATEQPYYVEPDE